MSGQTRSYRAVRDGLVTLGLEIDQANLVVVRRLLQGDVITTLEERTSETGVKRVKIEDGWCSVVSSSGLQLLERVDTAASDPPAQAPEADDDGQLEARVADFLEKADAVLPPNTTSTAGPAPAPLVVPQVRQQKGENSQDSTDGEARSPREKEIRLRLMGFYSEFQPEFATPDKIDSIIVSFKKKAVAQGSSEKEWTSIFWTAFAKFGVAPQPADQRLQQQQQQQQQMPPPAVPQMESCIDKLWGQLKTDQQSAAVVLGWAQQTWNDGVCPIKFWAELSPAEKRAAKTLGFAKRSWDTLGLEDAGGGEQVGQVSVRAEGKAPVAGGSEGSGGSGGVHHRLHSQQLGGTVGSAKKGAVAAVPNPRKVRRKPGSAPPLSASARKAKLEFVAARSRCA